MLGRACRSASILALGLAVLLSACVSAGAGRQRDDGDGRPPRAISDAEFKVGAQMVYGDFPFRFHEPLAHFRYGTVAVVPSNTAVTTWPTKFPPEEVRLHELERRGPLPPRASLEIPASTGKQYLNFYVLVWAQEKGATHPKWIAMVGNALVPQWKPGPQKVTIELDEVPRSQ